MSRTARRVTLVVLLLTALLSGGAALAVTRPPGLTASGPVQVDGVEASAAFRLGDRTIRQVRYADRATLSYVFTLRNPGLLDVTVVGLASQHEATLLRLERLERAKGAGAVTVPARGTVRVVLEVRMTDCERLSARASSLVGSVALRTRVAGFDRRVDVELPEELRTGSAREMFCPLATAKSRPPG